MERELPPDRSIEASNARLAKLLERVLADVEAGNLPIVYSPRLCERFNHFPVTLNARHAAGDLKGVDEVVREINLLLIQL